MARVTHQKSAKQASSSNGVRGSKVAKGRKNHKIIIENNAQDNKEQSRAVISFHAEPPPGYTFIPAGNPQLTSALKEFAKRGNHQILGVTTTPHAARHELSREVHRIGFHFPTEVVAQVCNHYGIRLTSGGTLIEEKEDDKLFMRLYQKGQLALDKEVRDQVTINTEAKQIIQDLFPNIPENDLFQIIKTAFQLGQGKVGTADELPLVRRAQLAVVAHIRHTFTSYDKLLRAVSYVEARHQVESITLQKLIDWRGDGQNDKQAMDDTLREVVVISDEEGTDDEIEEGQVLKNKDLRVQPVVDVTRKDMNPTRPQSPLGVVSDEEAPRGYRYLPQVVRRYPIQDPQLVSVSRQQSRYAVWDRVRQEHRGDPVPPPPRVVERILLDESPVTPSQVTYMTREPIYVPEPSVRQAMEPAARIVSQPSPPTYIRGADGKLYERIATQPEPLSTSGPLRRLYTPPPSSEYHRQYIDLRQTSPRPQPSRAHQRTESFENNDGTILPSIESPGRPYHSQAGRRNPFEDSRPLLAKRQSGGYELNQRLVDLPNATEQASKRQRIEVTPPSPYIQRNVEREQNNHEQYGARSDIQYSESAHPSQSQRLIPLENPGAEFDRRRTYERHEVNSHPTTIYRDEVSYRDIPSSRETNVQAFASQSATDPYYASLPRRNEYINDNLRPARVYGGLTHQYSLDESMNGANDRISRVVLDDVPLQRHPSAYGPAPATRHVHPEARNPFDAPGQPHYYVQQSPIERSQREYGSTVVPVHNSAYDDTRMAQYPVHNKVQQHSMAPPPVVYRDGQHLRQTYVPN